MSTNEATEQAGDGDQTRPVIDSVSEGIATITLNDPQRRNALSVEMRSLLTTIIAAHMEDPAVRAIIITGTGNHFCTGGDMQSVLRPAPHLTRARVGMLHDLVRLIITGPKPVIAAVEGVAYGAGLSIGAACDFVVASETAAFCAAFGKVGLIADAGLMWSLPQRVGGSLARRLLLTAEVCDARRAVEIGLADVEAPTGCALQLALENAKRFTELAPLSISTMKTVLAQGTGSLESILSAEKEMQVLLTLSADYQEGRASFRERRKPIFNGS